MDKASADPRFWPNLRVGAGVRLDRGPFAIRRRHSEERNTVATGNSPKGPVLRHSWPCLSHGHLLCVMTACAMIVVGGCVHDRDDPVEPKDITGIDIGIKNVGTERLERATVKFGEYRFAAGIVSAGHEAVNVCSGQLVPDSAEVFFELKGGRVFEKTVDVKTHAPTDLHGEVTLYFTIGGNHDVSVEFFRSVKVNGRSKLVPY